MIQYCPSSEIHQSTQRQAKYPNLLKLATVQLASVYARCNQKYTNYIKKPKRIITFPNEPLIPNTNDNIQFDYVFSVHDWLINQKKKIEYQVQDLLGKGTFGQVLLCTNPNGIKLALKIIKNRPAYTNQGLIEAKILRQFNKLSKMCSTTNCLKIYDAFMWKNHLCLAEQRMDNSLLDILKESDYEGIGIKWIEKWTRSLLFSLFQIHSLGIIHCDIKPQNIMFRPNDPDHPILIDFSSGCMQSQQIYTYIQSRFYRAPEVLLGLKPYQTKIDIWSLGCVLVELYIGIPLFPGSSGYDQISKIVNLIGFPTKEQIRRSQFGEKYFNIEEQPKLYSEQEYEKISNEKIPQTKHYLKIKTIDNLISDRNIPNLQLHELFLNLVKKMLVIDPAKRISAEQAYLHPFCGGLRQDLEMSQINAQKILNENLQVK